MSTRTSQNALHLLRRSRRINPSFRPSASQPPLVPAAYSTYISSRPSRSSAAPSLSPASATSSLQKRPIIHNADSRQQMSFFSRFFSSPSPEDVMAATEKAQKLIDENAVMMFSKSYCPFCRSAKRTLDEMGAKYYAIELNNESDGSELQEALLNLTGQRTVPNIFIGKEHIGGNSDLQDRKNTDLKSLLKKAGAIDA